MLLTGPINISGGGSFTAPQPQAQPGSVGAVKIVNMSGYLLQVIADQAQHWVPPFTQQVLDWTGVNTLNMALTTEGGQDGTSPLVSFQWFTPEEAQAVGPFGQSFPLPSVSVNVSTFMSDLNNPNPFTISGPYAISFTVAEPVWQAPAALTDSGGLLYSSIVFSGVDGYAALGVDSGSLHT